MKRKFRLETNAMLKVVKAFSLSVTYVVRAQIHKTRKGHFPKELRNAYMKAWADETLGALNVELEAVGSVPTTPGLFRLIGAGKKSCDCGLSSVLIRAERLGAFALCEQELDPSSFGFLCTEN